MVSGNVTFLGLVMSSSFSAAPVFAGARSWEVSGSRFERFFGKLAVNSFTKICDSKFLRFLDVPISYTRATCLVVENQNFNESKNLVAEQGKTCALVSQCVFQEIKLDTADAKGGGINCQSGFTDLTVESCQFSEINFQSAGDGACVYFSGANFKFVRNCVNDISGSATTCVDATATAAHEVELVGVVVSTVSSSMLRMSKGQVTASNINLTRCGVSDTATSALVTASDSTTSIGIARVTISDCSGYCGFNLAPAAALPHGLDTFNVNSLSRLFVVSRGHWLVTRVWMTTSDSSTCTDGTLTFGESFIASRSSQQNVYFETSPSYTFTASQYIAQLSFGTCAAQLPPATPVETWTLGSRAKGLIAASVIGGIAIGALVFVVAYFTVKGICKWRERRYDDDMSAFELN